jgi:hypothetical protein
LASLLDDRRKEFLKSEFTDRLGNTYEFKMEKLNVYLTDGPFYAQGGKREPRILKSTNFFIESIEEPRNSRMLVWQNLCWRTPNGLSVGTHISPKFVFIKQ